MKRSSRKIQAECKPYCKNFYENLLPCSKKIHFVSVKQLYNPIIWYKTEPLDELTAINFFSQQDEFMDENLATTLQSPGFISINSSHIYVRDTCIREN